MFFPKLPIMMTTSNGCKLYRYMQKNRHRQILCPTTGPQLLCMSPISDHIRTVLNVYSPAWWNCLLIKSYFKQYPQKQNFQKIFAAAIISNELRIQIEKTLFNHHEHDTLKYDQGCCEKKFLITTNWPYIMRVVPSSFMPHNKTRALKKPTDVSSSRNSFFAQKLFLCRHKNRLFVFVE